MAKSSHSPGLIAHPLPDRSDSVASSLPPGLIWLLWSRSAVFLRPAPRWFASLGCRRFEEGSAVHAQRFGEGNHVRPSRLADPGFPSGYRVSADTNHVSELLLRQAGGFPQFP